MHLLVIEDNKDILANLIDYLTLKGHIVDSARDGLSGLHRAATEAFDLIILDLMLPGIDGITVCQRLRNDGNNHTPIIMLTARDALDDRLQGFQAGADDYLIKPFALAELGARIDALMRRSQGNKQRKLLIGDLSYDLDTLEVERQGKVLKLHSTALTLLKILMQKSPHIVKRETLEQSVWGDNLPDSDSLRSHIHMLRQIIDKPFDKPLLHTVHGLGYKLAEITKNTQITETNDGK